MSRHDQRPSSHSGQVTKSGTKQVMTRRRALGSGILGGSALAISPLLGGLP